MLAAEAKKAERASEATCLTPIIIIIIIILILGRYIPEEGKNINEENWGLEQH